MRPTKDYATAVERIIPFLPPSMEVERVDYGFMITLEENALGMDPVKKSARDTLALSTNVIRLHPDVDQDEVREAVQYIGRIPARGLSDWQMCALEWLHWSPPRDSKRRFRTCYHEPSDE